MKMNFHRAAILVIFFSLGWLCLPAESRPQGEQASDPGVAEVTRILEELKNNDIHVVFKSNIHQKFAIMDQKTVWYGSINLLSYGSAQESIMRIESSKIANELIKSIESP